MLIELFYRLKKAQLPVSITEYLLLLEALDKKVISGSINDFYYLCRATMVKDERFFDRFDLAFSAYF